MGPKNPTGNIYFLNEKGEIEKLVNSKKLNNEAHQQYSIISYNNNKNKSNFFGVCSAPFSNENKAVPNLVLKKKEENKYESILNSELDLTCDLNCESKNLEKYLNPPIKISPGNENENYLKQFLGKECSGNNLGDGPNLITLDIENLTNGEVILIEITARFGDVPCTTTVQLNIVSKYAQVALDLDPYQYDDYHCPVLVNMPSNANSDAINKMESVVIDYTTLGQFPTTGAKSTCLSSHAKWTKFNTYTSSSLPSDMMTVYNGDSSSMDRATVFLARARPWNDINPLTEFAPHQMSWDNRSIFVTLELCSAFAQWPRRYLLARYTFHRTIYSDLCSATTYNQLECLSNSELDEYACASTPEAVLQDVKTCPMIAHWLSGLRKIYDIEREARVSGIRVVLNHHLHYYPSIAYGRVKPTATSPTQDHHPSHYAELRALIVSSFALSEALCPPLRMYIAKRDIPSQARDGTDSGDSKRATSHVEHTTCTPCTPTSDT